MGPTQHACVRGRRQPASPPPAAPAANVVVAERTPRWVGAEPGCAGCQALSLHGAGGYKCVRGPYAQGWYSAGSGVPLSSLHSSTDASSCGAGGCSLLPIGQGVTAGLAPWGRGGNAEAGSAGTCSTQGQHGHRRRLDAPDEGVCSRDRFATMVSSPIPGRD